MDEECNAGSHWSGIGHSGHPLGDRNLAEMLVRAPRTDLDAAIHGLPSERVLRITTVSVIDAYDVVRLEYEVVPAREPPVETMPRHTHRGRDRICGCSPGATTSAHGTRTGVGPTVSLRMGS